CPQPRGADLSRFPDEFCGHYRPDPHLWALVACFTAASLFAAAGPDADNVVAGSRHGDGADCGGAFQPDDALWACGQPSGRSGNGNIGHAGRCYRGVTWTAGTGRTCPLG